MFCVSPSLSLSSSFFRLFSLARPSDQEHLLIDPEMNPESVSSFFSVIIGKKSLMQRWEVQRERERSSIILLYVLIWLYMYIYMYAMYIYMYAMYSIVLI